MAEHRRKRTIQIGVRLVVEEFEALRREANRRGWTVAQVVRKRALKGLDVAVVPAGGKGET